MNCMYWEYRFPRLVTIRQMQHLIETNNSRLLAIGDISCDPGVLFFISLFFLLI